MFLVVRSGLVIGERRDLQWSVFPVAYGGILVRAVLVAWQAYTSVLAISFSYKLAFQLHNCPEIQAIRQERLYFFDPPVSDGRLP